MKKTAVDDTLTLYGTMIAAKICRPVYIIHSHFGYKYIANLYAAGVLPNVEQLGSVWNGI